MECLNFKNKRYVYIGADGVCFNVRSDDARQCILFIIGVKEMGTYEYVAIENGYRESKQSLTELLLRIKAQGLKHSPELTIGDGVLGFGKVIRKVYPETRHQRCWVNKMANVMNKVPKTI